MSQELNTSFYGAMDYPMGYHLSPPNLFAINNSLYDILTQNNQLLQ
jgi:hypothetical protein